MSYHGTVEFVELQYSLLAAVVCVPQTSHPINTCTARTVQQASTRCLVAYTCFAPFADTGTDG